MKRILLWIPLIFSGFLNAQTLVSTTPSTKNVLIEAHTGVDCPSCPSGSQAINNYLSNYSGQVFAVQMHAFSTGHTTPIELGDEDLRRGHPDLVRQYMLDAAGIPCAMMNRRFFNGERTFFNCSYPGCTQPIDSAIQEIIAEPSPINIGLDAFYDTIQNRLVINTEAFATDSAMGDFRWNVYMMQNNVVVTQNAFGTMTPGYNHKRVFREVLTPTWGMPISNHLASGDLFSQPFYYENDTLPHLYQMEDMEVLVFITDHAGISDPMGEVVQVMKASVNLTGSVTTQSEDLKNHNPLFEIFPNPNYDHEYWIKLNNPLEEDMIMFRDLNGKLVHSEKIRHIQTAYLEHPLSSGIYFVYLQSTPHIVQKLVVD